MKQTAIILLVGAGIGYLMAGTLAKYPPFSNAYLLGAGMK